MKELKEELKQSKREIQNLESVLRDKKQHYKDKLKYGVE